MPVTYANDIAPKFRPQDIACMDPRGIDLDSADFMCDPTATFGFADHGNAQHVYARLSDGSMPPDAPWPGDWLATYQSWMTDGFQR